jgi:hypothetical protein
MLRRDSGLHAPLTFLYRWDNRDSWDSRVLSSSSGKKNPFPIYDETVPGLPQAAGGLLNHSSVRLLASRLRNAGLVIQSLLPHDSMSHPEPSTSHRRRIERLLNVAHDRQVTVDVDLHIVNGR